MPSNDCAAPRGPRRRRGGVATDQIGLECVSVREGDFDQVRAFNDVIIGDDMAVRINNETGAQRFGHASVATGTITKKIIEAFERRAFRKGGNFSFRKLDRLRRRNIDDRGRQTLRQFDKAVGRLPSTERRTDQGRQNGT